MLNTIKCFFNKALILVLFLYTVLPTDMGIDLFIAVQIVVYIVALLNLYQNLSSGKPLSSITKNLLICAVALILFYGISNLLFEKTQEALEHLGRLITCITLLAVAFNNRFDKEDKFLIKLLISLFVLTITLWWGIGGLINGFKFKQYSAFYSNSNTLGAILFPLICLSVMLFKKHPVDILTISLSIIFLVLSDTRSTIIALAVVFALFLLFKLLTKKQKGYKYFMLYFLLILVIFPVGYTALYGTGIGDAINDLCVKLTGKNFFSGRQTIWGKALTAFGDKPLFGYGLSANLQAVIGDERSMHNWFIQILLRGGLIGFALTIIPIILAWYSHYKKPKTNLSIFSLAVIIGVLIYQSFEVTLTENILNIGMILWLVMGFNINNSQKLPLSK